MRLTNTTGINLALAVWLAHDDYSNGSEDIPDGEVISATTLLKPVRQFVLAQRVPESDQVSDIKDFIASSYGTAIHDSVEKAWTHGYQNAMKALGYPQKVIDRVEINPESPSPDSLPVYLEQRAFRQIDGVYISGKFDLIVNGEINDIKTTSVWGYIKGSKEEDYRLQMSIYRWLNPEKVTSDRATIQLIFTDWSPAQVNQIKGYPTSRLLPLDLELLSLQETETWIRNKLRELKANISLPEQEITRCTDKELWRSDPVYKYYSDPAKAQSGGRATKNFDTLSAAQAHRGSAGKGIVITVPGQVKACGYCPAFTICSQKDEYDHARS
jgi:hypothetical protein